MMIRSGTSLVVQRLILHLPMQGVQFQSLVTEPRSYMPCSQKAKTLNRNNIITNSIKTLKLDHIKKILKKNKVLYLEYKFIFTSREWGGVACLATGSGMGAWSAKSIKCQEFKKYQREHWSRARHREASISLGQNPSHLRSSPRGC